jgi:Domain of unknown function (DUF4349)
MRRIDENPIDPEITAELDAIDATLAGEPVDPAHADLAELALLLAAERPAPGPDFAQALDQRVQRRFAHSDPGQARPRRVRASWLGPLAGLSAAAVAAVVAVVLVGSSGGGGSSGVSTPASAGSASAASSASVPSARTSTSAASSATAAAASSGAARQSKTPSGAPAVEPFSAAAAQGSAALTPSPLPNGRKTIQSAQLALSATPAHIDAVAQQLFVVVGHENGYVNNSAVTAGSGAYAQFQLSVPSLALQDTMTALSQLHYATVASRTDATQDVNGQYLSDQRKLADDRALRTSLLKQLANAVTQQQIDSLNARIRDAEASIRSDESTLRGLNHKIDFSQISVTINGAPAPLSHHRSSGFTLGRAAHDAGRVLTVAAGVSLIVLAALVPLALIGALAWWISVSVRRRRREHALDLA